jgi:Uma2 family endonuclease
MTVEFVCYRLCMSSHHKTTWLENPVPTSRHSWTLDEEDIPETPLHQRIVDLLVSVFTAWITRTLLDAMAGSNIALRWDSKHPARGVDPDVYLVEPAPPGGETITSLRLWEEGHHAPRVAVEVVSDGTADKDYDPQDGPARYAAAGVRELWVFDPLKLGPSHSGGPWALQIWRRTNKGGFRRIYKGDGPAFSRELGAWVVVTNSGMRLRIANDAAGKDLWLTAEEENNLAREQSDAAREQERIARQQSDAAREQERIARQQSDAARIAAEAEVTRLRALLEATKTI